MPDDELISGAAAPVGRRRITSLLALDGVWVIVSSVVLLVSSRFALIDLPNQSLRTGDAPLRVWVVGLPLAAVVMVVVGAVRRSSTLLAAAAGVLAPSVAFAGSLAISLFLDDASAFADDGVAVSLCAAVIGAAMLLRWFVYHPADVIGDESRPVRRVSDAVSVVGAALAVSVVVGASRDGQPFSAAGVFETSAMLTVAAVVVGSGLLRTRRAMALAGAAGVAQLAAVIVVRLEQSDIPLDSRLLLRSGVIGLMLCGTAAIACAVAWFRHSVDVEPGKVDDEPDWRWSPTD
ncbi:MAG: hypothetical protein AB8G26_01140 [Ilumatobacter sp.]